MRFPEAHEFKLKDDPLDEIKKILQYYSYTGWRRFAWFVASVVKFLLLVDRFVYVIYLCIQQPHRTAEFSSTIPVAVLSVVKLFYLYYNQEVVDYIYDTVMEEFWDCSIFGPDVELRVRGIFILGIRLIKGMLASTLVCLFIFLIRPPSDMPSETDRLLPNVIWFPFDINPSPLFEIIYVMVFLSGAFTIVSNFIYDYIYWYGIFHVVAQLHLLRELLINVTDGIMDDTSDVDKFNSPYFQKMVMERLKVCAAHHSRLLRYGENLAEFCSIVMIPEIILIYASLVINGFALSLDISDLAKAGSLLLLTVLVLVEFSFFAVSSSILNSESLLVLDAIYASNWYLFDKNCKRACIFMMMNGQDGMVVKAPGMTVMNNQLVVSILQKAFSAITLLQAMVLESAEE